MTPKFTSSAQASLPDSKLIYPTSYLSSPLEYQVTISNSNVSKSEFLILSPKLALTTIFQYQLMATLSCLGQTLWSLHDSYLSLKIHLLLLQKTVLVPPSKPIQYSSILHILHCYDPNRYHHHLSTEI